MSHDIRTHKLVELINELGLNDPPVVLFGFPQRLERKSERVRLYSDLSLTDYLEFNQDDMVYVLEGETEEEPVTVMVHPEAQITAVSRLNVTAKAMKPTPDPWQPDANPCQPDEAIIPALDPAAGQNGVFAKTAVQLFPKMCRFTGPIYQWRLVMKNTPFGPQVYYIREFIGFGMDCSY